MHSHVTQVWAVQQYSFFTKTVAKLVIHFVHFFFTDALFLESVCTVTFQNNPNFSSTGLTAPHFIHCLKQAILATWEGLLAYK